MIVRINIGLANAHGVDLSTEDVHNLVLLATDPFSDMLDTMELQSSGGDWEPEPVYWAELEVFPNEVENFKLALEGLCVVLQEDSIAVAIVSPSVGTGTLIFNPRYEGERYQFNLDYFTDCGGANE